MYSVLIMAAGKGTRMNSNQNKILLKIKGKTILEHSVDAFQGIVDEIIVVVSKDDYEDIQKILPNITLIIGGETRMQSVFNGLLNVKQPYVLVHDAARCNIRSTDIENIKSKVIEAEACALGTRVKDTIKDISSKYKTVNRNFLVATQTPQAAKTEILIHSYIKAIDNHFDATDEMQVLEFNNISYEIVFGREDNMKVTTPFDLRLMEILLEE